MLLGRVRLHLHRARVVLPEDVLHRVEVVLAHVAEPAPVVVPVAAEGAVDAVGVVGLAGRRPEPQVVVELGRHGLGLQVRPAAPVELPVEAGGGADGRLEGPAQEPALHHLLDRLDVRAEPVEPALEAEPGVEPEDPAVRSTASTTFCPSPIVRVIGFSHQMSFPASSRRHGDQGVPVGRRGDVDDVDVRPLQHLAEVRVALHAAGSSSARARWPRSTSQTAKDGPRVARGAPGPCRRRR